MLGILPTLIITLLLGIGSIVAENAGELPDQSLPFRTDGCYLNDTFGMKSNSNLYQGRYSLQDNMGWKDQEYSGWVNFLSISYLWQPLITVCSTVFFGLIFSIAINIYKKRSGWVPTPVPKKYFTPVIVSMWVRLLGKERLQDWIDFDEK